MTAAAKTSRRAPSPRKTIKGSVENWEKGRLGLSEEHAVPASEDDLAGLIEKTQMKLISIRLPEPLIGHLKLIAQWHAIGYQPLVRDVLNRFARNELKDIVREIEEMKEAEQTLSDEDSPAAKHLRNCP